MTSRRSKKGKMEVPSSLDGKYAYFYGNVSKDNGLEGSDVKRYNVECTTHFLGSSWIHERVFGGIGSRVLGFCLGDELESADVEEEDAIEQQQDVLFASKRRQKRLLEMSEVERRKAKPNARQNSLFYESDDDADEMEKNTLMDMLKNSTFDTSIPVLYEGGEFKISEMFRHSVPCSQLEFLKKSPIESDEVCDVIVDVVISDEEDAHSLLYKDAYGGKEHVVLDMEEEVVSSEGESSSPDVECRMDYESWESMIKWDGVCDDMMEESVELTVNDISECRHVDSEVYSEEDFQELNKEHGVISFHIDKLPWRLYEIPHTTSMARWKELSEFGVHIQWLDNKQVNVVDYSSFQNNSDFQDMHWLSAVTWEESRMCGVFDSVLLDMNDEHLLFDSTEISKSEKVYTFNVSNDDSDLYKNSSNVAIVGRTGVQHASFALDLDERIFRPYHSTKELLSLHKESSVINKNCNVYIPVKDRVKERKEASSRFVPTQLDHLSAKDGRVILVEYIEEHPVLLNNAGMGSEIVTYYRHNTDDDDYTPPILSDGTFKYSGLDDDDESPFLCRIRPGRAITAINNNMYVAPVFEHSVNTCDFLLVRTVNNWFIREIPAIYTAGQIQPKLEIPAPNSRSASKYMKQRLAVYIYRHLLRFNKVQISNISNAFRDQSESAIRAELKDVAEFQRGGSESGWWIRRDSWVAPRESELHERVSPEDVCAYESMLSCRERHRELGISTLKLSTKLSAIISKLTRTFSYYEVIHWIEETLQLSSWDLTSNFKWVLKGQGFLKLSGAGNPLGKGQGFSCLRAPTRLDPDPGSSVIGPTQNLTGTDKDLRSLPNDELADILMSFGLTTEQVDRIPRWERVDLVREKATDAVLSGIRTPYARFARSHRNTFRSQKEQFRKDFEKLFEAQCETLSSRDQPVFPEDEDVVDEWALLEDSLLDEEKQVSRIDHIDEEKAYAEWRMQREGRERKPVNVGESVTRTRTKKLLKKIVTIFNEDGSHEVKESLISDEKMIQDYILDQQDGGNRFRDNDLEEFLQHIPKKTKKTKRKPRKAVLKKLLKPDTTRTFVKDKSKNMRCGACRQLGHTKSNMNCPMWKDNTLSGKKRSNSKDPEIIITKVPKVM